MVFPTNHDEARENSDVLGFDLVYEEELKYVPLSFRKPRRSFLRTARQRRKNKKKTITLTFHAGDARQSFEWYKAIKEAWLKVPDW